MKYIDEFRDHEHVAVLAQAIKKSCTQSWTLMELCGGQTHAIMKYGIDQLLPEQINLVHGPGCPVCVTPLAAIDKAIAIAELDDVIFCTFGDMLRVPGSAKDLMTVKAEGGDVRAVYSPLEAVTLAEQNPDKHVVFFAVGFETTIPTTAMAAYQAKQRQLSNFKLLVSHVRVPPAMQAILAAPENRVQGFLAAGNVCVVMGYHEYLPIAAKYQVPIVVTGFEPVDILQGILHCVQQLEENRAVVENQYGRAVTQAGNVAAQTMIERVFEVSTFAWRGLGEIENSGFQLNADYAEFDAAQHFQVGHINTQEPKTCKSGDVLQGILKPFDCPEFGKRCTPENPLGATMVSSEGACAAYYAYRWHQDLRNEHELTLSVSYK